MLFTFEKLKVKSQVRTVTSRRSVNFWRCADLRDDIERRSEAVRRESGISYFISTYSVCIYVCLPTRDDHLSIYTSYWKLHMQSRRSSAVREIALVCRNAFFSPATPLKLEVWNFDMWMWISSRSGDFIQFSPIKCRAGNSPCV